MKKLFSALTALLLSICFISCMADEISDSANSQKEGSVILSIKKARTISPAKDISYKDVPEWTVTFKDTDAKYDDIIVENVIFNESLPQEIRLPVGTYDVIFEGSVTKVESDDTTVEVPFYGKDSVTVVEGKTVPISVFVAPKKSNGGTGSFNFTVNISGLEQFPDPVFESKLIPYSQGEEQSLSPTFSDSILTVTTQDKIPSGFYTLSIKYTWDVYVEGIPLTKTKEIYYPNHDFLVEIVDGLETKGSADITVSLEDSKIYYATTGKTIGNGAFKSMPKNLDELLEDIDSTTISTANIIMVDSLDADGKIIYPEIDVSKVNATGMWYEISVLTSEGGQKHCYSIKNEDGDGNPTIYTEVDTVNLKDSSAAGKTVDVYNIVELKQLLLSLKNSTSVAIKSEVQGPVILDKIDFFDYYSTHPFMTAESKISDLNLSETLEELYTTASKTISASEYEYYILPAGQDNPTINGIAYDLVVTKDDKTVTDTQFYVGDTVTITATSESEGGSFADGTTFAWFINGERTDCTDQSYTIKFGEGDAVAENTIICLVGYNKEYATKSIKLTAQENTIVLYNNTSDTGKPALSYATLKDSSVLSPNPLITKDPNSSLEIVDYCFDNSNNLYAIVRNTGVTATIYSINKYTYSDNGYYFETTYDCNANEVSSVDYIEAADDGKLYAVMTNTDYMTYIAQLTSTEPTPEANGTVSFNNYISPDDWGSIQTFCTDGKNFYVIVSITSYDDTQTKIQTVKLVSCTVSNSHLTETTSILLASTDESDTSPVFSNYGDALEYRDLCCINNKLYLLVRDVVTEGYNNTSYSRGALCIFTVSDSGITADKIDIGYQTTSSTVSYTGSYDSNQGIYPTITRTTYFGDGSSTFYGPVKFVARKQDELIIADDGFSIEVEDYASVSGHTQATVSSKNAVVTYNLNTESLNFVSLDGEYFENKYSGYFYSSDFYE